jgi:hypothetical protein
MNTESSSQAVLDHEYLPVRAKILEIAASLDRLQRAPGTLDGEARWDQLRAAIELLLGREEGRAERVQLLFSRPYDHHWRESFQLAR